MLVLHTNQNLVRFRPQFLARFPIRQTLPFTETKSYASSPNLRNTPSSLICLHWVLFSFIAIGKRNSTAGGAAFSDGNEKIVSIAVDYWVGLAAE